MKKIYGAAMVVGLMIGATVFADEAAEQKKCAELKAAAHKQWMQVREDNKKIDADVDAIEKLMLEKQAFAAQARRDETAAYLHCKAATADMTKAHALWAKATTDEHRAMWDLKRAQGDLAYANAEIKSTKDDQTAINAEKKSVADEKDAKIKAEKDKTLQNMEAQQQQDAQQFEAAAKAAQARVTQAEANLKAAGDLKAEAKKLDPNIEKEENG